MEIAYTAAFIRQLGALPVTLWTDVIEKIELFKDSKNHKQLKVHKLSGRLKGRYSFSVSYKLRIVFVYLDTKPKGALLHTFGDHDVYST
jgi:mRNA-degrading endonuclease YafQ of YafQ-DinJ toxin-antitoxin module